ncbi:hypothetical protein [Gallaecimonas mangrovi]|uniref:hypothetical protein n=1 Tax=Gallaecimonas mangrovi TaxID=2291597 RepID=UPI000E1FB7F4|nr:hypothetical protein [Gallaecimonas mangrovi]
MQITPLLSNETRTAPGGIAAGAPVSAKHSDEAKANPPLVRDRISAKALRHGQWALLSQAQSELSSLQATEQSVVSLYRELLKLARQLEQSGQNSEQLSAKVEKLAEQVVKEGQLGPNLAPKSKNPRLSSYELSRVDLLSPRPQDEQVMMRLPTGHHVSLTIRANSRPSRVIADLSRQLSSFGISVEQDDNGQLLLTGDKMFFRGPWQMQGQGIRVPAGNPVPISLEPQRHVLDLMADGLHGGDVTIEKQRVRELLNQLEQHRRQLQAQRNTLLAKIAELRSEQLSGGNEMEAIGAALKTQMQNAPFEQQLSALLAQANLSRFSVVALLGG